MGRAYRPGARCGDFGHRRRLSPDSQERRIPESRCSSTLSVDPNEQRNIAGVEPARLAELDAKIDELLSLPASTWGDAPIVDLDEARKKKLRQLGYALE